MNILSGLCARRFILFDIKMCMLELLFNTLGKLKLHVIYDTLLTHNITKLTENSEKMENCAKNDAFLVGVRHLM